MQHIKVKSCAIFGGSIWHKRAGHPISRALFTSMVRNLLGFLVVTFILLAAVFAHQEAKLSRARDAWRMEDNREERRKEVKVETLAVKDQDQQDYTWRKVAQREGILRTTKVDSIGKEAATPRREEDEATRRVDRREREAVSTRREEVDATRRVENGNFPVVW